MEQPLQRPSGPPVSISLVGPVRPIQPGSSGQATVTIQNSGTVVDELLITVSGLPADWVKLPRTSVSLPPGRQETVTVVFQPPRRADSRAGDNPFAITVTSRQHVGHMASASGVLHLTAFNDLSLALSPQRSRRNFEVLIQNRGNEIQAYDFSARDEEHGLGYKFGQPAVTLLAGQAGAIPLEVVPKVKPRIGVRKVRTFTVTAAPRNPALVPTSAAGQLLAHRPIPIWFILLLLLLLLCLCIGSAYAYVTICPMYGLPLCPGSALPVINVFRVTPEEVTPGGTTVLAWDVSGAEQVEISPVPGIVEASGTFTVNPQQPTIFTLRATNFAGTVEQSAEVKVSGAKPAIQSFTVEPPTLVKGQVSQIVFSWVASGADQVSISGVSGTFGATGSATSPAPAQTTRYTLTATNASGTATQELAVTVIEAGCRVTNLPEGERLNLRRGPSEFYDLVDQLDPSTDVVPLERNETGEWLKVQAGAREGWASSAFITCQVPLLDFPTAVPGSIPPPPATDTPSPTTTATLTPTPHPTPTFTPTATP